METNSTGEENEVENERSESQESRYNEKKRMNSTRIKSILLLNGTAKTSPEALHEQESLEE